MKHTFFALGFLLINMAYAQRPAPQKPTLLKGPSKTQTISMEYKEDILYFDKTDILTLIESMSKTDKHPQYNQILNLLYKLPDEIAFKKNDSTQFKNVAERNLYKMVIELAPEMQKENFLCRLDKKTKQLNSPKPKDYVSMEYTDEIVYYAKADLASLLHRKATSDKVTLYEPAIAYLNTINKPVSFTQEDTSKLTNSSEKKLYKLILEIAPRLLAESKAADKVKKTGAFNKQVFVNACENKKEKKIITEKKGRVIFGCD